MVRNTLLKISDLLEEHTHGSNFLPTALAGDDAPLWDFLISNDLWGGAGSIADQALMDAGAEVRRKFYRLMVDLGHEQMKSGKVNARTSMWVEAFEKWIAGGHV